MEETKQTEVTKEVKVKLPIRMRFSSLICTLFGHQYFKMAERDNGTALEGFVRCQRCRYQETYIYTYKKLGLVK